MCKQAESVFIDVLTCHICIKDLYYGLLYVEAQINNPGWCNILHERSSPGYWISNMYSPQMLPQYEAIGVTELYNLSITVDTLRS